MTDTKDKSDQDTLSNSEELFENLFREATLQYVRKAKPPKPAQEAGRPPQQKPPQTPPPTQQVRQSRQTATIRKGVQPQIRPPGPPKSATPAPPPPSVSHRAGKVVNRDSQPSGKPEQEGNASRSNASVEHEGKISSVLKLIILGLLFLMGAAVAASYMGFVDFGNYFNRPADPEVETTARPIVKPIAKIKLDEKPAPAPENTEPQALPQNDEDSAEEGEPQPLQSPPAAPEEDKLVKMEPEQKPARAQPYFVPPHPFSIYLGSFMTLSRTRKAVSIYEKDYGIPSYWTKVDLGEKGIWYRVYTGAFRTQEEAEAFVRQKQIIDGKVMQTGYSTLIGVFSRAEEAKETEEKLMKLGYSSYAVNLPDGRFKLYSGAFNTLEEAQKQSANLASSGIKTQAIER